MLPEYDHRAVETAASYLTRLAKPCPGLLTGGRGPPCRDGRAQHHPTPPGRVRPVAPGLRVMPRSAAICNQIYSNFSRSLRSSGFIRKYAQDSRNEVRATSRPNWNNTTEIHVDGVFLSGAARKPGPCSPSGSTCRA